MSFHHQVGIHSVKLKSITTSTRNKAKLHFVFPAFSYADIVLLYSNKRPIPGDKGSLDIIYVIRKAKRCYRWERFVLCTIQPDTRKIIGTIWCPMLPCFCVWVCLRVLIGNLPQGLQVLSYTVYCDNKSSNHYILFSSFFKKAKLKIKGLSAETYSWQFTECKLSWDTHWCTEQTVLTSQLASI